MKSCPSFEAALAQLSKDGKEPKLRIRYSQGISVTQPGVKLSSADTKAAPTLSLASSLIKADASDKYTVVCLDLDAPFPSFTALGPACHWIDVDLAATGPALDGFTTLESTSKSPVFYAGPAPPPPSAPHRYVFLIWEQPNNMNAEKVREALGLGEAPGVKARMRWDQPACEKKLGLSQPIAVNYFTASSD